MTPFQIHCSPGSPWYVGFTDQNNKTRFLPTRKKIFGSWKKSNCPTDIRFCSCFIIDDGYDEDLTPDDALSYMEKKYTDVESYLKFINR